MDIGKVKPKQKRGRKPKGAVTPMKPFPKKTQDTVIIHLSPPETTDELPGLDTHPQISIISDQSDDILKMEDISSPVCWNCCATKFIPHQIPYKRVNDVYYVTGNFCSYECGARHIYDTYEGRDLWERYTLLNMYYNESMKTTNKHVHMSHSRYRLKELGGDLTREEYHSLHEDDSGFHLVLPPFIPVDHIDYGSSGSHLANNGTYKLYRVTPIKKNHILESLKT